MPWARLDDNFSSHPKVRKAWRCRPALGLHAMAMSYSMCHGLEGKVPSTFVEDQLPNDRERSTVVAALVEAGIWEPNGDGWYIHDFLDYNPSNADIEARREADRERKRKGRNGES